MTDLPKLLQNLGVPRLNAMQTHVNEVFDPSRDLVLYAPTGSGKTLAFLLCLLKKLAQQQDTIQALVVVPTRELAKQADTVIRKLNTGYRVACIYGGHSVREEIRTLEVTPAILVGTPGRILDLAQRQIISLKKVHTLVLDEFDKSLELGFEKEMTSIVQQMYGLKTKMLVSATVLKKLPDFISLHNPVVVQPEQTSEQNNQTPDIRFFEVRTKDTEKMEAAFSLACSFGTDTAIFFCNHREAVDRLSSYFKQRGLAHAVFHGGFEQLDREKALICFSNGSCPVLIATDLAARGLDVNDVTHVVHFQLPSDEKSLTHRNGRTARAGKSGNVYLLLTEQEYVPEGIPSTPTKKNWASEKNRVPQPQWATVHFNAGKKEKITKTDLVGFLCQTAKLDKNDIGLIALLDHAAYVAVKKNTISKLHALKGNQKIKKQSVRIHPIS